MARRNRWDTARRRALVTKIVEPIGELKPRKRVQAQKTRKPEWPQRLHDYGAHRQREAGMHARINACEPKWRAELWFSYWRARDESCRLPWFDTLVITHGLLRMLRLRNRHLASSIGA